MNFRVYFNIRVLYSVSIAQIEIRCKLIQSLPKLRNMKLSHLPGWNFMKTPWVCIGNPTNVKASMLFQQFVEIKHFTTHNYSKFSKPAQAEKVLQ